MAKSRSGRFEKDASKLLDLFNASLPFDKKLYEEDIKGSKAHASMLANQNILTKEESKKIIEGLDTVLSEIKNGEFVFDISDEDIHMAIEKRLSQIIGEEIGGKLHTARSRNDQVALDFRLYVQKNNLEITLYIKELIKTLLKIAKEHTTTILPGMTHLQHAQPINFAFHLLAYISMFKRDIQRFESSYERADVLPLGCAALAGTPHNINREEVAKSLGFKDVSLNCLDTVSDRDFALEILFNISTLMMHISRFAEELVIWSSSEFGFITFSDEYSTGSSIMPQKKNPDVAELLRGKSGRAYGNMISLFTVLKALPLAYNKDMQEDKEGVFDSVQTAIICLKILEKSIDTMSINKEKMKKASEVGHLSATDLADYLVKECKIPFREAHHITGSAVARAEKLGIDISKMSANELKQIDGRIKDNVVEFLSLESSMNARNSQGGTSTSSTLAQIANIEEWLKTK